MIGPGWYAAFLLIASGGVACLLYAVADIINHDWAAAHLWPLLLAGAGLVPVLAFLAHGWRWWERVGTEIDSDRASVRERNANTDLKLAALEAATQAAAGGDEAEPDPEPDTAMLPRLQRERDQQVAHWQVYLRRIVAAAEAYGWDIRTLTVVGRPTKVTSPEGWRAATDALAKAGYLAKDKSGTRLLVSLGDWNAEQLWRNVPAPAGEPPDIAPPPYTHTNSAGNTTKTAAEVVISGTAREAGQ